MKKTVLKQVAKDWAKSILQACEYSYFTELLDEGLSKWKKLYEQQVRSSLKN